jgi:hypothetical protein
VNAAHIGIRLAPNSAESSLGEVSSANTWDVFRLENLALEGFTNATHNEVLEVSCGICSFAFLAPCSHTGATLHVDEPRVQRAGSGAGNGSQPSECVGIGCQPYQPMVGFK